MPPIAAFAAPPARTRQILWAGCLAGTLLFAGATGFGQHVRSAGPIQQELDRLLVSAGLGINEISLSGHRQTLDRDIFRALGASGATLLSLDIDAARKRIEALPWVESARIVRVLPDRLKVDIRERQAAAIWIDGERAALIDAGGRVLALLSSYFPPDLPRVAGPGAPEAAAELIAALAREPELARRVQLARRIGERRWDLELEGGVRARLPAGDAASALARLTRLARETRIFDKNVGVVDLTSPHAVVVAAPSLPNVADRRASATPLHAVPPKEGRGVNL